MANLASVQGTPDTVHVYVCIHYYIYIFYVLLFLDRPGDLERGAPVAIGGRAGGVWSWPSLIAKVPSPRIGRSPSVIRVGLRRSTMCWRMFFMSI